ncbi:MAG: segregation and condensation protein [Actinomycetota bacterium]|nr:segregation and condensation protein [Actinomycetota bacterium]
MTASPQESTAASAAPVAPVAAATDDDRFAVSLDEFSGPFDLLLALIAKHKLDVTELALHQVTDDYIAYIRAQGGGWDLDETTEFVVVAATLLDLKAARLLPNGEVSDEDDLELLDARDLLFARLLQYRAFKAVSAELEQLFAGAARTWPRTVGLEPEYAAMLPDVVFGMGPAAFAELAAEAMTPRPEPQVSTSHIHSSPVSVREQAVLMMAELRARRSATFRSLVAHAESIHVIIARFLALLELYREGVISFDQAGGLAELHIRWTGDPAADVDVSEFDEQEGATS